MNREPKTRIAGGPRRPRRAPAVLLMLLLAATPAMADAPEIRARRLLDGFLAGWLERHPEQLSRLGDHSRDRVLPLLSSVARARDAAWYRDQRESLAALPTAALPPALQIDVRLAFGRAAREASVLDGERLPERDPGYVLERLHVALTVPIRGSYASPCSRAAALRFRLRAVPEYLRDARIAAAPSDRAAIEFALERAAALLEMCRVDLPRALAGCREARVQADLAQADSMATRALMDYVSHLRDELLPEATNGATLGAAALAERLGAVAGTPVALDTLLRRARTEWSKRNAAIGSAAGDAGDGDGRIGLDSAAVLSDRIRAGLVAAGLFSKEPEEDIELHDRPAPGGAAPLVTLGAWDARGARARLDLGSGSLDRTAAGQGVLAEDPLSSAAAAELVLAREGWPGRALLAATEARAASRARQALGADAIRDGWGRYAEALWARSRTGATREAVGRRHRRLERERLARAVAELMLRVESASIDDATRWLERGADLSPAAARRAALEAAAAPRWAASTLALWGLEALCDAERAASGGFASPRFHAALLAEGAVPTAWIAEPVLAAMRRPGGRE